LFAVSDHFWMLLVGRALIGLGVASAMTGGLKALVLWFPGDRVGRLYPWPIGIQARDCRTCGDRAC
jgi:MFS family permease